MVANATISETKRLVNRNKACFPSVEDTPRRLRMAKTRVTAEMVAKARAHKMTPTERREQRVSLIMGMRGNSSTLTREKVTTILAEVEGLPA